MNFIKFHQPQYSALWKTAVLFILVSGFLIATDRISLHFGLHGSQRIVDDLLGGLIAGSIFYLYERQRLRRFSEIDFMNHHIRNALQPLMSVTYVPGEKAQMKLVEECVRHINWALSEVVPVESRAESMFHIPMFMGLANSISSPPKQFFSQWLDTWRARNKR